MHKFAVDPMATDLADWTAEDFSLFARLLRIERPQILAHAKSLFDRQAYFREIQHRGDLFLDPDTGVGTGRCAPTHIAPAEISELLKVDRLLAIYQHVRARRVADRVDAVCAAIQQWTPNTSWCSYESGTVAMIFVAPSRARVESVQSHFGDWLGRHATGRVRASWA